MSTVFPVLTIGPTVPSFYLDRRVANDKNCDINLFQSEPSTPITNWLNTKPQGSVVYVAFGSMATLPQEQMEELAWGLPNTNFDFLWVVREEKLPADFLRASADKAMIVQRSCPTRRSGASSRMGVGNDRGAELGGPDGGQAAVDRSDDGC